MARNSAGKHLGAVFVLIGGLLLTAALFAPWFSNDSSGSIGGYLDVTFYLGLPSWDGTVQVSCGEPPCPLTTSYASAPLNSTGMVAEVVLVLASAASVLAVLAGALGLVSWRNVRRDLPVMLSTVAALVLGVFATVFFAATIQFGLGGPWNSFWGSRTSYSMAGGTITVTWGPSTGWYLSIVAAAALLAGAVILFWGGHDPASFTRSTES